MNYAQELGIDLDELRAEHPFHPDQLRNRRRIIQQAEKYWSHERFRPDAEYSSEAIFAPPEPVKIPRKRTRVRRYEFTDAQLEIARRSLDAGGAV
jgi:hypothetical protein